MLSKSVQMSLSNAFGMAHEYEHEFVTLEHLLLELLSLPDVQEVIVACGGRVEQIEAELEAFLASEPLVTLTDRQEIHPTMSFQRVIERAIYMVQSNGYNEVVGNPFVSGDVCRNRIRRRYLFCNPMVSIGSMY
jgi:ATP-dependent Clp protease ATP-binding subunit ClpA